MSRKEFSADERQAGVRLLTAVECFRELRHTMPMQYILTFLMIALEEGLSVGDYAKKAGVSPSVMSRHVLDLGMRQRNKIGEGFGLLETRLNLENLREHSVHLTPKGVALFHRVARVLS
jgi:DNA-binding MarR family transcriptional regulator